MSYSLETSTAKVPFPAPGGPKNTHFINKAPLVKIDEALEHHHSLSL